MSVAIAATQAAFCATFIDELVVSGVTDAVLCPGSRSTPLAIAAAESELRLHVRLDERSAGFFALGLARATGRPVLVVVTSGTAVAELHPAVAEAGLDRIPLVLATADRPAELHEIGAPQTIRQSGLFSAHAVFSFDPGPVHALPREDWRSLTSRLVLEATGCRGVAGPVHFNVPLVEPFLAEADEIPARRTGERPWLEIAPQAGVSSPAQSGSVSGVVLAGGGVEDPELLLDAAVRLGWPVLADPRSGCRRNSPVVVASADVFLRDELVAAALRPGMIVLAGAPPASKVLAEWVRQAADEGVPVVVLGRDGPARYPFRTAASFVLAEPAAALAALAETAEPAPPRWCATWRDVERAAQSALDRLLGEERLSEPAVARLLSERLSAPSALVCSSSMPVRDLEWFGATTPTPARVHANRGANGIDGVVSTAMGVASAEDGPTVCLIGDLAFLHDVSALVDGVEGAASLVVVVLDNGGGGIFSFLPQRAGLEESRFEQLFGTPRKVRIDRVARGFDLEVARVTHRAELLEALDRLLDRPGVSVVVVDAPSRDENVALHAALNQAVGVAVRVAIS